MTGTPDTYSLADLQSREAAVMSLTARDLLAVLDKVLDGYSLAIDLLDETSPKTQGHLEAVAAARAFSAFARERYAVDFRAVVVGYTASCDEPGCFANGPKAATIAQAADAARAAGWSVTDTDGGMNNDARCPEHLPAQG